MRADLVQPPACQLTLLGQCVVHHAGRHIVGAVDDLRHERPNARFAEVCRRLQLPLVADKVVDHRGPFGPKETRPASPDGTSYLSRQAHRSES
jgi:hypothetical protein